ncbi:MAG: glutathione S-transferase family protein [Allosphingosinicella sp.]
MIRISAFKTVPPFAKGLVRDLRVRWALEEAALRYEVRLLRDGEKDGAEYRAWQPFGQVPAYEENGLKLFESGAIVLRIAERSETLLPGDPAARARAIEWLFAALNTIEPPILNLAGIDLFYSGQEWAKLRRPDAEAVVRKRLAELAAAMGDKPFLDGPRFTAGDLMMATVLRILRHTELVTEVGLSDYLACCEARPAFQRALAGQMAAFGEELAPRDRAGQA